ncbi:MAG: hypothetical protein KKC19_00905 [Nanoarchaeota archaeon]|nr:hypothetical protein [Nanoarchaeota archaeon]
MNKRFLILPTFVIFLINSVSAHCPLCTIGAGVAGAGAVWLGVSKVVVALFIGAFAMSMGFWFSNIIKKRYVPFQKTLIVIVVFATTVFPLMPIFSAVGPLYLSFVGDYGTTYAVNYSLGSTLLGGIVILSSPSISRSLTRIRKGKMIPFQGMIITFLTLIITGSIIQILI